jgi:hypothetical protein
VRAATALPILFLLGACAPKAPPEPVALGLDCAQPFETQAAAITAQPLNPAPKDRNEPYRFYSTANGKLSYLITEPGAPGHPAIMMQRVVGGTVETTGCRYGDQKGYDQLHAYLDGLKHWTRK